MIDDYMNGIISGDFLDDKISNLVAELELVINPQ